MAYQYNKINFKDLVVSEPNRYKITRNKGEAEESSETVLIEESFGTISQKGTLVNAENLNHIEEGIDTAIEIAKTAPLPWNEEVTYSKDKTVYVVVDGRFKLFISSVDDNIGNNPLTSPYHWAETSLGGNGYDWLGTLEEYNLAFEAGTIKPEWLCLITDDIATESSVVIDDSSASLEKVYSSEKTESIVGNLETKIMGIIGDLEGILKEV